VVPFARLDDDFLRTARFALAHRQVNAKARIADLDAKIARNPEASFLDRPRFLLPGAP
jgi:hypothetical protein